MPSPTQPSSTYAERQAYCLGIPGYPGTIDWWLLNVSQMPCVCDALRDVLMLDNTGSEYVICTVEPSYEVVSDTLLVLWSQVLILISMASRDLLNRKWSAIRNKRSIRSILQRQRHQIPGQISSSGKAPRSLFDRFCRSNQETLAPLWTRWSTHFWVLEFQQPTATFAKLFARMASWEFNKDQVLQTYQ